MTGNKGMIADYHKAKVRMQRAQLLALSALASMAIHLIIWWPLNFDDWLWTGFLLALAWAFFVTAQDYEKMAGEIERAYADSFGKPG